MEAKHEAGHYLKVKYNWISVDQASTITYPQYDTGYFNEWNCLHIEGEELKSEASMEELKAVPEQKSGSKLTKKKPAAQ